MKRRTFRAWKCRQNIHRIDLFGNGTWPTCKDCRAEIDFVVAADATAGPDMLVIALERFGRAHVSPDPPKIGDTFEFGRWTDGRDFFGDPQQPLPYRVLADPPQPVELVEFGRTVPLSIIRIAPRFATDA